MQKILQALKSRPVVTPSSSTDDRNQNNSSAANNTLNDEHVLPNGLAWPLGRVGHCVACDDSKTVAFMFGGYSSRKGYFGDLWCFPLVPPVFPSLLNICAFVVQKHYDVQTLTVLPEELKTLLISYPAIHKDQTWILLNPLGSPGKRTTAGIAFLKNKIWLFGGSEGSPTNGDLFAFDLDTLEWSVVDTSGSKPYMANGVTFIPANDKLLLLCPPDYYLFDPETSVWEVFKIVSSVDMPYSAVEATVYAGKMYYFGEDQDELWILDMRTHIWSHIGLAAPNSSEIDNNSCCCFANSRIYRFHQDFLLAFDIADIDEKATEYQWTVVKYEGGATIHVGSNHTKAIGSASRVFIFGNFSSHARYSNNTYVVDVAPDLSFAKVMDMKQMLSMQQD